MSGLTAGVDLGGTKIQTVVIRDKQVVGKARVETPRESVEAIVEAIAQSVRMSLDEAGAGISELAAVGIGTPGTIDRADGTVANAVNVPPLKGGPVPLGPLVGEALGGVKSVLENDVRAAVLGEWKRGAGRPYRDFLGIFVGTGVGSGIVLENRLQAGRGAAGEIGHTIIKRGGRRCGCGGQGHLESYAGRGMMEVTARRWQDGGRKTKLFDIMKKKGRDRVTSGIIQAALEENDSVAKELIDDAVSALGVALANAATLLDLEAIIIGGGLGDRLGAPFVGRVASEATPLLYQPWRTPKFLTTELGDLSGSVGAAVLAGG